MELPTKEASQLSASSTNDLSEKQSAGRPRVPPFRSLQSSLTSSLTSSPRESQAQQNALATSRGKKQEYRAGARIFKEDHKPRAGLESGDVVVFRSQEGVLVPQPLPLENDDATAVHFLLDVMNCSADNNLAHLEVLKQGKWYAFRSAAAEDRFLQARKRSPRLVFFNTNIGTWEQWELAQPESLEQCPWAEKTVTFKHRRLSQFELKVTLNRVGSCTLLPNASLTSRSLVTTSLDMDLTENVQLKKISGVVMHEWFNFVDREKQLRMNIAAQVTQLVEDATNLKSWTVSQVDTIRGEMDEEITLLLDTIQCKSKKLEDTMARLTARLRWGIAVLQTKNELRVKRQIFNIWRGYALSKNYSRHVLARLKAKVGMRFLGRVWTAWTQHHQEQLALRQKLWIVVRRMAASKMHQAFISWQQLTREKKQAAAEEQRLSEASAVHMQKWRIRQGLLAWRSHVHSYKQGRSLLTCLGLRIKQQILLSAFTAWREFLPQQQLRVDTVTALLSSRRRHVALQQAMAAWRLAVDVKHGQRLQICQAERMLNRIRQQHVLQAWNAWHSKRKLQGEMLTQILERKHQHHLQQTFAGWHQQVTVHRKRREALIRFVSKMAMDRTRLAIYCWRGHTAFKRQRAIAMKEFVERKSAQLLSVAFSSWSQRVVELRRERLCISICQRREASRILRTAFAGWRAWLARKRAKDSIIELGHKRTRRNRLATALRAFAANVDRQVAKQRQAQAAVQLYDLKMQKAGMEAWKTAVCASHLFRKRLSHVGKAIQVKQMRNCFKGWQSSTQESQADKQRLVHAKHLLGKLVIRASLQAWRGYCSYKQYVQDNLRAHVERSASKLVSNAFGSWREQAIERRDRIARMWECTIRISQLRMSWAFHVWQKIAAERQALRQAMEKVKRRMDRIKLAGALKAWRQQTVFLSMARCTAEELHQMRAEATLRSCFDCWQKYKQRQYDRQAALMRFVLRRSTLKSANVLHFWKAYVRHVASRRQQLQRACSKLQRVRMQQALGAWHHIAQKQRMLSSLSRGMVEKLQAKTLASCFTYWMARIRYRQQLQQKAAILEGRTHWKQLKLAFSSWQHIVRVQHHGRYILFQLARRIDAQCMSRALQAWRQHVHRVQHLQRLEHNMAAKRQQMQLTAYLKAWRQHCEKMQSIRAAINTKHAAEAAILLRHSLRSWKGHVCRRQSHRISILERCIDKKVVSLQSSALLAWRQYTQARLRSEAVMLRAVDRLAMRLMRTVFSAWHTASRARVARRTAIARFINRWQQQRIRLAFWRWQDELEERKAALDNLRRCLTRKRVAFKLFRNWYWDSFDDEMQETLRTMFEIANEAANDPLPSRMGSPIHSLLSSPIRAQLAQTSHQQQFAAGVAQRLANSGSLQPAYLRLNQGSQPEGSIPDMLTASLHVQLGCAGVSVLQQPLPLQPAPLRSRVTSSRSSPAKPSYMPAPAPNLGGETMAPLRNHAAASLAHSTSFAHHHAGEAIPVQSEPQVQEREAASPHLNTRQPEWRTSSPFTAFLPETSMESHTSGAHSKVASTVVPRSPLTPTSDSYTGCTPMTHYGTPNPDGMFTVSHIPGTVLGSVQKEHCQVHGTASAEHWRKYDLGEAKLQGSPTGLGNIYQYATSPYCSPTNLSDAPTPVATISGEYKSLLQQGTSLSAAGTPVPGMVCDGVNEELVNEPTPQPYLQATAVSPAHLEQQLADAVTPVPQGRMTGPQGRYQVKRMSGSEEVYASLYARSQTPQGTWKTAASLPELQGNYTIRRMSAATMNEFEDFGEQDTPDPDHFIPAFPGTLERMERLPTDDDLNAAKTPLYINPMCFDSPSRHPTELG